MKLPKDIEELKQFFKVFSEKITEPCYEKPKIWAYALGLAGAILLGVVGDHFISSIHSNRVIKQKNAEIASKDENYTSTLDKKDEEITSLKYAREVQKTSLALLTGQKNSLEEELQGLKSTPLGEQVVKQKDEIQGLSQNCSSLQKRFENLEKTLREYQENHPITKNTYTALQTQLADLKCKVSSLEEKLNVTQEDKDEILRKYTNLKAYLGNLPQFHDKIEQIEKDLRALRQPEKKSSNEHYDKGNAKLRLKLYKEAIEEYDQTIAEEPQNANAYNNRGVAKYELSLMEDYDTAKEQKRNALTDFDRAVELKRDDADYYNNRGCVKAKLNFSEDAQKDFDTATKLNENNAIIWYNQGTAIQDMFSRGAFGLQGEAVKHFKIAIRLNPNFAEAHNNLGVTNYYALAEKDEVIANFSKSIDLQKNDSVAYYNRGITYYNFSMREKSKIEAALSDFDKALEIDPNHNCLYRLRSSVKKALGLTHEAKKDLLKDHELSLKQPEHPGWHDDAHFCNACGYPCKQPFILIEK